MDFVAIGRELKSADVTDELIVKWLSELNRNIFLMDPREANYVGLFLNPNWLKRGDEVAQSYCEFILNLVTAYTAYVRPVLQMILSTFIPVLPNATEANVKNKQAEPPSDRPLEQFHQLLCSIFTLIPISSSLFIQMAADNFPYLKKDSSIQELYTRNLLDVTHYLPSSRKIILELILSKMIQIDVHCPKDEIEDAEQNNDETIFEMETVDQPDRKGQIDNMKNPLAKTLDCLLVIMYEYIDVVCRQKDSSELDWESTKKLYKDLLTIFDGIILPTYACAHVQYVMFYMCSFKPMLGEGFIDYLWKKLQNPNISPVIRQSSACYIGSLLCRAKYIRIEMVKDVLQLMCSWLHAYIDNQVGSSRDYANFGHHGAFYSVCQTVLYVFAFRHKELVEMKKGMTFLRSLNFDRLVTSNLNPFKVCLPAVVTNFASVARNYQIAYCYTVIERNNRLALPVASEACSLSAGLTNFGSLETFFPFDPYLLKRSNLKITPIYRVYQGSQEAPVEESDEEDEFLQESISGTTPIVPDVFSYGISPGFKEIHSPTVR